MGTVWGLLKMLLEWWQALKAILGLVEKAKHESNQKEISDKTDVIKNSESTEEERLNAVKDLEDVFNRRT